MTEKKSAFTLVELLVVMAIIGILVAMLLPALSGVREAARKAKCRNNLKQTTLALHAYHEARGEYPPAGDFAGSSLSWSTYVLPYMEGDNLYDDFNQAGPYHSTTNLQVTMNLVPTYLCPSFETQRSVLYSKFGQTGDRIGGVDAYTIHYYGVMGPEGTNPATSEAYDWEDVGTCGGYAREGTMLHDASVSMAMIRDGSSNTYLLGELSWDGAGIYRMWARGTNDNDSCKASASAKNIEHAIGVFGYQVFLLEFNDASFGSMHPGGTHFAYADGSVHFVNQNIDLGLYKSMASRAGGEAITPP
ncbi:MAG: DUF1559 domain-containing protein [Pirellulales bacterium]|nr:DUF1559 domain-containing protein [Pirellulales bacterium]